MTYKEAVLKRRIEHIAILPLVWLGKLAGKIFPLKTKNSIFLFFAAADLGGAPKVNLDITECLKENNPLIIFSKKPKNNKFLPAFQKTGVRFIDLSKKIDNKLYHFINIFYRGVIASWINAAEKPVVFGGETLYFYKIIPHIKKTVKVVELCHLNTWFNYSQAFIDFIDARVFSTQKIKRDAEALYKKNNLPATYFERLFFIDNSIDIPLYRTVQNHILQVLYVGRGAPQKRVHLLAQIVQKASELNLPIHFTFVGDVQEYFKGVSLASLSLLGEIPDKKMLEDIYWKSDVLILTSKYEGLPIVVMEMMARGKCVLSTAVDSIPDYIFHLENGLLISAVDEDKIVDEAISLLELLISNPDLKRKIGEQAYRYASDKFSWEHFKEFYVNLLR